MVNKFEITGPVVAPPMKYIAVVECVSSGRLYINDIISHGYRPLVIDTKGATEFDLALVMGKSNTTIQRTLSNSLFDVNLGRLMDAGMGMSREE